MARAKNFIVALALLVTVGSADALAAPRYPVLLGEAKSNGSLWYSATVIVPPGARLFTYISWQHLGRWTADGCFQFTRGEDKSDSANGSMRLAYANAAGDPAGSYQYAAIDPKYGELDNLKIVENGNSRPKMIQPDQWGNCSGFTTNALEHPIRIDLLLFVASREPLRRSRIAIAGDRGVHVLADSWGQRTHLLREWNFHSTVLIEAGDNKSATEWRLGYDLLVMSGATTTVAFKHSAASIFQTGNMQPLPNLPGPPGTSAPALLSVSSSSGNRPGISSIEFVGSPDRYQYNIEMLVASSGYTASPGHEPSITGKPRYVALAVADADFPACTSMRVKGRRNGHPYCR